MDRVSNSPAPHFMYKILDTVCAAFNLGKIIQIYTGNSGISNEKYRIHTDTGEFFIKVSRNTSNRILHYVHDVELFMISKGVPAVTSINATGRLWLVHEGVAYIVYPFIKSNLVRAYSLDEYEEIGKVLAKIHWASQNGVPDKLFSNLSEHTKKDAGLILLQKMKESILTRLGTDENDRKILNYLDYKISLAPNLKEGNMFVRDALVHGDFHPGNLLFNQEAPAGKRIIGVCDWERARYGSRGAELAHAVIFSCFPSGFIYERAVSYARAVIHGYKSEYQIINPEIAEGFLAHLHYLVLNTWDENECRIQKKIDVSSTIAHERTIIELLLSGKILKDLGIL